MHANMLIKCECNMQNDAYSNIIFFRENHRHRFMLQLTFMMKILTQDMLSEDVVNTL